ncbi:hypothetical protein WN944_017355 [Citrus x changshan-huyou]|uniref:Uncharacterized protein n=1 Tax=Citrus x changshan-huyou TaxID=2935761 RepID=A0AAP0QPF5_9ROSI
MPKLISGMIGWYLLDRGGNRRFQISEARFYLFLPGVDVFPGNFNSEDKLGHSSRLVCTGSRARLSCTGIHFNTAQTFKTTPVLKCTNFFILSII